MISLDTESYFLYLTGQEKRSLISRLQKAISGLSSVNGARDNLYRIALVNQATQAGALVTEYDASLSEFLNFQQTNTTAAQDNAEVAKMLSDAGLGDAEKLAARQQANNALISANVMYSRTNNTNTKKQIQSWVEIITSYIIE